MHISKPTFTNKHNTVHMKVPVSMSQPDVQALLPQALTYTYTAKLQAAEPNWAHALLVMLLPVAMYFKEDIEIDGPVSTQLLYNLEEYQRTLQFWRPQWFTKITIKSTSREQGQTRSSEDVSRGVMGSYSGGTDSMFALCNHLPASDQQTPLVQMTHCVHLEHWDGPQLDSHTNNIKVKQFSEFLHSLNVELVTVQTNAKDFHYFNNDLAMAMTFSSIIVGVAHLFDSDIKHFVFAADNTHDFPLYSSINHTLVPLMQSESLLVTVFGQSVSKLQKLERLSKWSPSYDNLLVCWEHPNGMKNCGYCMKCCHTMTVLDMLGTLSNYSTFPRKVSRSAVRETNHKPAFFYFPKTWRRFAYEQGRWDYYFDFTYALWRSRVRQLWVNPEMPIFYKLFHPIKTLYMLSAWLKKKSFLYSEMVSCLRRFFS